MTASAAQALTGRRESARLAAPSVRHFADLLAARCRDDSWVRTAVASLDRFATLTRNDDLEALLARALDDPSVAAGALARFAAALAPATRPQIAALALGPKLWFTFNGVDLAWRALAGADWAPSIMRAAHPVDRLILLALVGSGLHRAELLRLTLSDVGRLDRSARLVHDIDADPLAVRYVQRRGQIEYVTFFTDQAREVLRSELERRRAAGENIGAGSPLVANAGGLPATVATAAGAAHFNSALISAGNAVNVELCRKTGDFFRTWGAPGARFSASSAPLPEETT